jgi:hypothetical protein
MMNALLRRFRPGRMIHYRRKNRRRLSHVHVPGYQKVEQLKKPRWPKQVVVVGEVR